MQQKSSIYCFFKKTLLFFLTGETQHEIQYDFTCHETMVKTQGLILSFHLIGKERVSPAHTAIIRYRVEYVLE